jgi:hypothetical protein
MRALAIALVLVLPLPLYAQSDISLFDGRGQATAYVAVDDGLTIFMWSGKPVAYLERDSAGGFHVYGFNGKHLGWFVSDIVRDHNGNAACATKARMRTTEFEPFKSFKEFKPFKSFKEFAPFRPFFSRQWSETSCALWLGQGAQ